LKVNQLNSDEAFGVGIAAILISMLMALPFTIIVTLALIHRFRKRVERSMQAAASAGERPEPAEDSALGGALGELLIKRVDVTNEQPHDERARSIVVAARRRAFRLAGAFGLAACAHPLVLAAIMVGRTYKPQTPHPVSTYLYVYASFFVIAATPVALAVAMILTRQLRFLILTVLALIAALWAWGCSLRGSDPVGLWVMIAGFPTAMVLLLNARRLRAIGPIVFAATLFLFCAIIVGQSYGALYLWNVIGPVHFIREDLAQLPFPKAAKQYLDESENSPKAIATLLSHPLRVIQVDHAERMTMGYKLLLAGISLTTLVAGVALAWLFVRWLAVHYRTRRASDQMLTIDVLMAIFTFIAFLLIYAALGLPAAVCTLAGFGGYKLFTFWRFPSRSGIAPTPRALKLLLLRVFQSDPRVHLLVQKIMQRWRYFGSIRLIAGTDLVDTTIEPYEFFEFLSGRLSRAFVKDREDLERRLSGDEPSPDPDGLYRIEDFFCHLDTWQMTVAYLASQADVVLMDLRGFSSASQGCTYEIGMLLNSVSVHHVVLMVDSSTDQVHLEETLRSAWSRLPKSSPNAGAGRHELYLVAVSGQQRTLEGMLGLLCEKARQ
jgi:hypothetical protein